MSRIKKRTEKHQMSPELEIKSIAHTVADQYDRYRKQANIVLLALAAVIAGWALYGTVSANNERKAGAMLDAASAMLGGQGMPADPQRAVTAFSDVVQQYGGTMSGAVAQYSLANTLANTGRTDEAIKAYESFVQRYSGRTFLLGMVYQRMGYAYLALGRQEDAVKVFGMAEKISGTGPATVELARIFERTGRTEEAQRKYKEVVENLATTAWAAEARSKFPAPDMKSPAVVPKGQGVK